MPRTSTAPASPRWLRVTAWTAFLVTLPSALWRVLMIVGLLPGTAELRAYELAGDPAVGYAYVVGLSIVQVATGFLTVGLLRPWGERLGAGGDGGRIPAGPAVGPAGPDQCRGVCPEAAQRTTCRPTRGTPGVRTAHCLPQERASATTTSASSRVVRTSAVGPAPETTAA